MLNRFSTPLPQIPPQSSPKSFVERAPSSLTRLFLTVAPTVTNEIGHAAASAAGYGSSCRSSLDMGTLGRRAAANRLLAPRPARAANSQRLVGERQRSDNESPISDTLQCRLTRVIVHVQARLSSPKAVGVSAHVQEPRLLIDGFVSLPLEPRYARSHSHLPNPGDPCAPRLEATDMPGLFVQVEIDARILAG